MAPSSDSKSAASTSFRPAAGRRELGAALGLWLGLGLLAAAGCRKSRPYYAVDYYFIPF